MRYYSGTITNLPRTQINTALIRNGKGLFIKDTIMQMEGNRNRNGEGGVVQASKEKEREELRGSERVVVAHVPFHHPTKSLPFVYQFFFPPLMLASSFARYLGFS
ncbi:hypothetical protein P3342_005588 [Pyrenophora teres f. teres]|nr:hypothetical protein P3342_005588 [Pyrenophora teres f. teres]